jgi:hypothetical protein
MKDLTPCTWVFCFLQSSSMSINFSSVMLLYFAIFDSCVYCRGAVDG